MHLKEQKDQTVFQPRFKHGITADCKKSSTYYSDVLYDGVSEYASFVERHHNSNTFAQLHIAANEAEYDDLISDLFGDE